MSSRSLASTAARAVGMALALALAVPVVPLAFAGAPLTEPAADVPIDFAAGAVCADPIHFVNTTVRSRQSTFDAAPDGSSRFMARGMNVSLVTDTANGQTYDMKGGAQLTYTVEADGSIRVDGMGTDIIAWYFPGDDAALGAGLFDIAGRITEWYAADGSFLRATFDGDATDICDALGA